MIQHCWHCRHGFDEASNIRVAVRCRPFSAREQSEAGERFWMFWAQWHPINPMTYIAVDCGRSEWILSSNLACLAMRWSELRVDISWFCFQMYSARLYHIVILLGSILIPWQSTFVRKFSEASRMILVRAKQRMLSPAQTMLFRLWSVRFAFNQPSDWLSRTCTVWFHGNFIGIRAWCDLPHRAFLSKVLESTRTARANSWWQIRSNTALHCTTLHNHYNSWTHTTWSQISHSKAVRMPKSFTYDHVFGCSDSQEAHSFLSFHLPDATKCMVAVPVA
jgi:hypothetical protein